MSWIRFGDTIKLFRLGPLIGKGNGLTQKQLAKRCGISVGALSAIEQNVRYPSFAVIERLARALKVSPRVLVRAALASGDQS